MHSPLLDRPKLGVLTILFLATVVVFGSETRKDGSLTNSTTSRRGIASAASLDSIASSLQWRAEFDSAARFYRRASARYLAEENWLGYVHAQTQLGASLRQAGDYELGLRTIQAADSIADVLGIDNLETRAELIVSYVRASRYEEAADAADVMLDYVQRRSDDLFWHSKASHLVGWSRHEAGDFAAAKQSYLTALRALPTVKTDSVSVLHSWILNNLGTLHRRFGHLAAADSFLTRSLTIRESTLPAGHPLIAGSLANLGLVLLDLGKWEKAIEYYSRATDSFIDRLGENHPTVSKCYANLGVMYREAGDLDSAWLYFQKSLDIGLAVYPSYHVDLFYKYLGLSTLSYRFGDHAKALEQVHRALDIARRNFRPGSPELVWAYERKGDMLESVASYAEANEAYESALAQLMLIDTGAPTSTIASMRVATLATSESPASGEEFQKEIQSELDLIENELGSGHPMVLASRVRAADWGVRRGLSDFAKQNFSEAAPDSQNDIDHPELRLAAVAGLSGLLRSTPSRTAADSLAALSAVAVRLWNNIGDELAYSGASSDAREVHSNWLQVSHETLSAIAFSEVAYIASERAKGMKLRAQIARSAPPADGDSVLTDLLNAELRLRRQLSPLTYSWRRAPATGTSEALQSPLHSAITDLKRVRGQIGTRNSDLFRARFHDTVAPVDSTRLVLEADEAVVSYVVASDHLVISVIDQAHHNATLIPADVHTATTALREAIEARSYREFVPAARAAYRLLVEPIEEHIEGKKLIIVPDGPLHFIPFELLLTHDVAVNTDERSYRTIPYLIRKNAISYTYSVSLLSDLRKRERTTAPMSFLGIAPGFAQTPRSTTKTTKKNSVAPHGADSTIEQLRRIHLPGTLQEVNDIRLLFESGRSTWERLTDNRTKTLVRGQATESKIRSIDLSRYRIIHLATHAYADESVPERSALILGEDASTTTDGLLQLREVYNLKTNADLVVLSACETGLGRLASGEGMIGLTRGFLYSGANSVVVSLWKADDWITRELMTLFYEGLVAGKPKSTALRDAKLDIIAKSPVHALPYHWAHFVLIGE